MEIMIARCGMECDTCPVFVATKKDDDIERKTVARLFGGGFKPEDINCDGCLAKNARHLSNWESCEIRKCCEDKGLENCAYCVEFSCEKTEKWFKSAPKAKENLEKIRVSL